MKKKGIKSKRRGKERKRKVKVEGAMPLFNLETPLPSTYILVKALDEDRSASVFYSLLGSRF